MPVISIIVPVYKAERYIRRCIKLIQGRYFTYLEII